MRRLEPYHYPIGEKQIAIVVDIQEIEIISELLAEAVFQGAGKDEQILADEFHELAENILGGKQ